MIRYHDNFEAIKYLLGIYTYVLAQTAGNIFFFYEYIFFAFVKPSLNLTSIILIHAVVFCKLVIGIY